VVVEGPGLVAQLKSLGADLDGTAEHRLGPDDEGRVERLGAGDQPSHGRQNLAFAPRQIPGDVIRRTTAAARLEVRPADADVGGGRRTPARLLVGEPARR